MDDVDVMTMVCDVEVDVDDGTSLVEAAADETELSVFDAVGDDADLAGFRTIEYTKIHAYKHTSIQAYIHTCIFHPSIHPPHPYIDRYPHML